MAERLDPDGLPVPIGPHVILVTPGLEGEAEIYFPSAAALRGEEQLTPEFEKALALAEVTSQLTVIIRDSREVPTGAGITRSTDRGEPAIDITVPAPAVDEVQFMLAIDEAGAATWHFPEEPGNAGAMLRGASTRNYIIRRHVAPPPQHGSARGLLGAIGNKVLKVLAFKAIKVVGGAVGSSFVRTWEVAKRPYRMRHFTPDDYLSNESMDISPSDWRQIGNGTALLFIHGTFSRAHTAFGGLPRNALATLHKRFGGRVFAFEHPTASEDPDANIRAFLARVPANAQLELDIVCHSRGGLVSRVLAERASTFGPSAKRVRVRKIICVAAPNAGTLLANPEHMSTFIDTYTNLLSFFPDNGVTDTLEVVISVLKQIAVGTLAGLDGLQAMHPDGPWLRGLNQGPAPTGTSYFAIASNFEPKQPGLVEFVEDRLVDAVFHRAANDLVVPTDGVYAANGNGAFPIADPLVLPATEGVGHSGYFSHPLVVEEILRRLS